MAKLTKVLSYFVFLFALATQAFSGEKMSCIEAARMFVHDITERTHYFVNDPTNIDEVLNGVFARQMRTKKVGGRSSEQGHTYYSPGNVVRYNKSTGAIRPIISLLSKGHFALLNGVGKFRRVVNRYVRWRVEKYIAHFRANRRLPIWLITQHPDIVLKDEALILKLTKGYSNADSSLSQRLKEADDIPDAILEHIDNLKSRIKLVKEYEDILENRATKLAWHVTSLREFDKFMQENAEHNFDDGPLKIVYNYIKEGSTDLTPIREEVELTGWPGVNSLYSRFTTRITNLERQIKDQQVQAAIAYRTLYYFKQALDTAHGYTSRVSEFAPDFNKVYGLFHRPKVKKIIDGKEVLIDDNVIISDDPSYFTGNVGQLYKLHLQEFTAEEKNFFGVIKKGVTTISDDAKKFYEMLPQARRDQMQLTTGPSNSWFRVIGGKVFQFGTVGQSLLSGASLSGSGYGIYQFFAYEDDLRNKIIYEIDSDKLATQYMVEYLENTYPVRSLKNKNGEWDIGKTTYENESKNKVMKDLLDIHKKRELRKKYMQEQKDLGCEEDLHIGPLAHAARSALKIEEPDSPEERLECKINEVDFIEYMNEAFSKIKELEGSVGSLAAQSDAGVDNSFVSTTPAILSTEISQVDVTIDDIFDMSAEGEENMDDFCMFNPGSPDC